MGDFDSKRSEVFENIGTALEAIEDKWKDTSLNKLIKDL